MIWHLKICGAMQIALALLHIGFAKRFNWRSELSAVSLINKQMMEVHTLFVALTVFLFGVLSFFWAHDLRSNSLAPVICGGLAIFWFVRLFVQHFVYSTKLWRGKIFETTIHVLFSLLWLYFASVYAIIAVST